MNDKELRELLRQANYFAFKFECMAPLYLVLTMPHSEEGEKSAQKIRNDVDLAKEFREKVSDYLKQN
jgi:hypothetical protein